MAYLSRTFSSLAHYRNYRLLFIGLTVSQIGTSLQDIAQSWIILEKTHSAHAVAILTALLFSPYAILGLVSAPLLERLPPRNTMLACQVLSFISALCLSLLCFSDRIDVISLYLFALLRGFIVVINNPVRQLLIRQCVQREHVPNAIALNTSILNMAKILGPAMGGVFLAYAGAGFCFLLNAFSYLVVMASLMAMNDGELMLYNVERTGLPLLQKIKAALSHLAGHARLSVVFVILFFISLCCLNFPVFLPMIAHDLLQANAASFGYFNALFAAGAFSGAIISAHMAKAGLKKILLSVACMGIIFMVVPFTRHHIVIISLLIVLGFFYTLFTTTTSAYIQLLSADNYQVSNIALYTYILTGINPLGALLIGFLETTGGPALAMTVPGMVAIAIVIYALITTKPLSEKDILPG